MAAKPLIWVGPARSELKAFPHAMRREAGFDLWRIQNGADPRDWRPMPQIGPGVIELRVSAATEHRVFYVAKFAEAIYVLHAFEKRSRKTAAPNAATGRRRFRDVLAARTPKPN